MTKKIFVALIFLFSIGTCFAKISDKDKTGTYISEQFIEYLNKNHSYYRNFEFLNDDENRPAMLYIEKKNRKLEARILSSESNKELNINNFEFREDDGLIVAISNSGDIYHKIINEGKDPDEIQAIYVKNIFCTFLKQNGLEFSCTKQKLTSKISENKLYQQYEFKGTQASLHTLYTDFLFLDSAFCVEDNKLILFKVYSSDPHTLKFDEVLAEITLNDLVAEHR